MAENEPQLRHAIVAGFGVPGRVVTDALEACGYRCTIIETNVSTVNRASKVGRRLVCGDARDPEVLRQAEIDTASILIVAIPNEAAALQTTRAARQLNAALHIITRTHFVSAGIEARQLGANEVVVAEQAVAREFSELLNRCVKVEPAPAENQ